MRILRRLFPALALAALPAALAAQDRESDREWVENCRRWNRDRESHCEVRETRLPARGSLTVDGRENGGVSVRAWDRDEVLVRQKIQATAGSEAAARELAGGVRVETGGTIRAAGPETGRGRHWSVSYEIFVPPRTGLDLRTSNGPIAVEGVTGEIRLQAVNGPISLRGVGGDVRGRAQNGPVSVDLDGDRWNGEGLDVETQNGPVTLNIPAGYNARLETGTVNGPMNVDFPVTVQGRFPRQFTTDLGRGGPPVRVVTTNGPVNVRRR